MERHQLKQLLIGYAKEIGIDKIGFASADPFYELKERLKEHRKLGYESGFEEKNIEKRTEPTLTVSNPKSIVSIALAYPSKMSNPPKSEKGAYRGIISRSAWGKDYHDVLRNKLQMLQSFLVDHVPGCRIELMVDTGVLSDRAVAERAGIGWVGKNCNVITPEFGSWVYLGEMITDISFEPDTPVTEDCGDCTICIDSCPTGAIVQPGQLDAQKCISFITQTKGMVPVLYRTKIGNRLYGCDTCQQVCPKNKGLNWTQQEEFLPDPEIAKPLLKPLLSMSNRDFKERFGSSASSWRGKKPIQRNAIIALGHFRDESALSELEMCLLKDPRPEIRGTAAWSIGRIGSSEAINLLHKAKMSEKEDMVLDEIEQALTM